MGYSRRGITVGTIQNDNAEGIRNLIDSVDDQTAKFLLNSKVSADLTPLQLAAKVGALKVAKLLLANGVDPTIPHRSTSTTPLMFAAREGNPKLVEPLLSQPSVNVNRKDNDGRAALMLASLMGWHEVIEPLIAAGADPNLGDKLGNTPLQLASYYCQQPEFLR